MKGISLVWSCIKYYWNTWKSFSCVANLLKYDSVVCCRVVRCGVVWCGVVLPIGHHKHCAVDPLGGDIHTRIIV